MDRYIKISHYFSESKFLQEPLLVVCRLMGIPIMHLKQTNFFFLIINEVKTLEGWRLGDTVGKLQVWSKKHGVA